MGWMKEVYAKPDLHYFHSKPVPYRVRTYHIAWDCPNHTSGLIGQVYYADLAQTVVVDTEELTPPIRMSAVVPDSVGEAQHALACKLSLAR